MTHFKITTVLLMLSVCACTGRSKQQATTLPSPAPKAQPEQETVQPGTQQPATTTEQPETHQDLPGTTTETETETEVGSPDTGTTTTTTTTNTGDETLPPSQEATPTPPSPPTPNPTGNIDIQGDSIVFQDLKFTIPSGWKLHQDTYTEGTLIMAFTKGTEYFRIYAKQGALPSLQSVFVNGSQVVSQEREETVGGRAWKRIDTRKGQVSVSGFALSHSGHAYYGFGRSTSQQAAAAITAEFLGAMK